MAVMGTGTRYEQNRDGKPLARRYYECEKCHKKIYKKDRNFQEYINKISEKYKNK